MSDHASNDRDDLPRQVDLAIVRVDPWGVMKGGFPSQCCTGNRHGGRSVDLVAHAQCDACLRVGRGLPAVHRSLADGFASGLRQASEGHGLRDFDCCDECRHVDRFVGTGHILVQPGRFARRWHQGHIDG